jgi:hypothetical protein
MKGADKAAAWIFDATGEARDGWLQVIEVDGELRPADQGWSPLAAFPPQPDPARSIRIALWADKRDKYVARVDLGAEQRWIICERLPALLRVVEQLNALVQLGRG